MNDRNTPTVSDPAAYAAVHTEIVTLLDSARTVAARSVNALMTASYWEIGRRIVEFEQGGHERAHYGQALIARLAADLSARFGRGFSKRNLEQMRLFYLAWPADEIAQTVSAQFTLPLIRQTLEDNSVSAKPPGTVTRACEPDHDDALCTLGTDPLGRGQETESVSAVDTWLTVTS